MAILLIARCCCWMYKSTNFLANHNFGQRQTFNSLLLLDVQKY